MSRPQLRRHSDNSRGAAWRVGRARALIVPVLAALLILTVACGSDHGAGSSGDATSGSTAGPLSTLTVAIPSFWAETLDPSMDGHPALQYHGHMYDPLVGVGPDGRFDKRYGVLEGWEVSADAKTYTLRLKHGIRWHDGEEMTADDVAFSLSYYAREGARCAGCPGLRSILDRVESPDRYTAVVFLKNRNVSFMHTLAPVAGDMPVLTARALDPATGELSEERPVGSGPWKFVARSIGEWIEYEANRDYWDPERVPGFDRLRLVLVPEPEERVAMLLSNAVDMTVLRPSGRPWSTGEPQGDVTAVRDAGFAITGPRYVNTTVLRLFTESEPDSLNHNLEFRKALALAIDTQGIIDKVYEPEVAEPAAGSALFNPLSDGFDPTLPPYPYDPEGARRALAASGYNGETVVIFSAASYGLTELIGLNELLADNLRQVGMNVEIRRAEYPEILGRISPRPQQFDDVAPAPLFHGVNYQTWPDILSGIKRYMTSAPGGMLTYYDIGRGDRLYAELSAIVDPAERDRRLRLLNREMYEEYWAIPIVWRHEVYGVRPGLSGWAPTNGTASDLHLETVREAPG